MGVRGSGGEHCTLGTWMTVKIPPRRAKQVPGEGEARSWGWEGDGDQRGLSPVGAVTWEV